MALSMAPGLSCRPAGVARIVRFHGSTVSSITPGSTGRVVECSVMLGSRQGQEGNHELESSRVTFRARSGVEMNGSIVHRSESTSAVGAAIILVVGAQCLDAACEKLRSVRSAGGLGFCIATKPFCFQGNRRRNKAEHDLATLKAVSDLLLVIDHETLMTTDCLTVMEATRISSRMVSLGAKAVSQLISDQTTLFHDGTEHTELCALEMILRLSGDANLKFGSGFSASEAVRQALDMFAMSNTEKGGLIICAVVKSRPAHKHEMQTVIRVLRSVLKPEATIACFSMLDTTLSLGCSEAVLFTSRTEQFDTLMSKTDNVVRSQATSSSNSKSSDRSSASDHCQRSEARTDTTTTQRTASSASTSDSSWESGPFSETATAWAKSRSHLPNDHQRPAAGVRQIRTERSSYSEYQADKANPLQPLPYDPAALPNAGMLRMGLDAVLEACKTATEFMQDRDCRKDLSLSQRAASMLENERSPRGLTPPMEMSFQGGLYRGRCEGGQPDGKGRLTFPDGSFYDGDWIRGKRNGTGAFYYANGDVYQGLWRDDLMHGKGWLYFRSGDRIHAEFVQGKAHGQGRYFSTDGSVLFGQFRDNMRHGECTFRDSSGSRWCERWHSGVLVSRAKL